MIRHILLVLVMDLGIYLVTIDSAATWEANSNTLSIELNSWAFKKHK